MRMSDNVSRIIDLLGCRVIVRGRIDEVAGDEVLDGHADIEVGIGLDGVKVLGGRELGRGHVGRCGDDTW